MDRHTTNGLDQIGMLNAGFDGMLCNERQGEPTMPNFRRAWVPGGTFFFTVVTHQRAKVFSNGRARSLLGSVMRRCALKWPFTVNAIVLLPEHLHAIWTLPPGDTRYPGRWGWIKKEFSREWLNLGGHELPVSHASAQEGRRGIWQPRYWEHT